MTRRSPLARSRPTIGRRGSSPTERRSRRAGGDQREDRGDGQGVTRPIAGGRHRGRIPGKRQGLFVDGCGRHVLLGDRPFRLHSQRRERQAAEERALVDRPRDAPDVEHVAGDHRSQLGGTSRLQHDMRRGRLLRPLDDLPHIGVRRLVRIQDAGKTQQRGVAVGCRDLGRIGRIGIRRRKVDQTCAPDVVKRADAQSVDVRGIQGIARNMDVEHALADGGRVDADRLGR